MNVIYSKTGSDGNASVISDGETLIQIDAGIKPYKVNAKIGYKISNIQLVICSHVHQDHLEYATEYARMGIPVYTHKSVKDAAPLKTKWLHSFNDNEHLKAGTFVIQPFNVPHINSDGTDCPNYGFLIGSIHTKERMLWVTDCSYIEQKFSPLDYICIECSYVDVDDYSEELEYINQFVEKRRLNSHMSLNRCIEFLSNQDLSKCKKVRLLHLTKSQGNIKNTILSRLKLKFPDIEFVI